MFRDAGSLSKVRFRRLLKLTTRYGVGGKVYRYSGRHPSIGVIHANVSVSIPGEPVGGELYACRIGGITMMRLYNCAGGESMIFAAEFDLHAV